MKKLLVPLDFSVPTMYKTDDFTIRKLTSDDTVEDYKAVMEAKEHIRKLYNITSPCDWPQDNLTLKRDEEDLKYHEKEFDERKAFAYTVFDSQDKHCLGCIYIDPSEKYDAEITMWTRDDTTDELLCRTVEEWIEKEWPFKKVYYPVLFNS